MSYFERGLKFYSRITLNMRGNHARLQTLVWICLNENGTMHNLVEDSKVELRRLLDLCLKFFQDFVTWKISQSERKPEPVESALSSSAE